MGSKIPFKGEVFPITKSVPKKKYKKRNINLELMKQSKLDSKSIQWIKDNPKEFIDELIRKSELVKNFYKELEPYRIKKDKEGYQKLFKELLKKEEEIH